MTQYLLLKSRFELKLKTEKISNISKTNYTLVRIRLLCMTPIKLNSLYSTNGFIHDSKSEISKIRELRDALKYYE
jgi:hypothetical protein